MVLLRVAAMAAGVRIEPPRPMGNKKRNAIEQQLRATRGKQLVIVRYRPDHIPHQDWINNRSGIDAAKIVWARDMGEEDDRDLLGYFKDRHVWLVDADDPQPTLEPYPTDALKQDAH